MYLSPKISTNVWIEFIKFDDFLVLVLIFNMCLHIISVIGPPAPLHASVCDVAQWGTFFYSGEMKSG